jgi:hypothetical protein
MSSTSLGCIFSYTMWLCWVMDWPRFVATNLLRCDSYWPRHFLAHNYADLPRRLLPTQSGVVTYTGATPSVVAAHIPGVEPQRLVHTLLHEHPTAAAFHRPTSITLYTASTTVHHVLAAWQGRTVRTSHILRTFYCQFFWISNAENVTDPLTRGVLDP